MGTVQVNVRFEEETYEILEDLRKKKGRLKIQERRKKRQERLKNISERLGGIFEEPKPKTRSRRGKKRSGKGKKKSRINLEPFEEAFSLNFNDDFYADFIGLGKGKGRKRGPGFL